MTRTEIALSELYLEDETAWLDAMTDLLKAGSHAELDHANLQEFLSDRAKGDRREVESRLVILLMYILKWVAQPDHRTRIWKSMILEQRQELVRLASHGVLRNHAETALPDNYREAVEWAAVETGLTITDFPTECEYTVAEMLLFDINGGDA